VGLARSALDTARRLRRAHLGPRDLLEVARILAVAMRIEHSLRHEALPATVRRARIRFATTGESALGQMALPAWARRRMALVQAVLRRGPVDDTCLRRALVAGHRLAALDPELVIGVRPDGASVEAHAWLRVDGCDLDVLGREFEAFVP
jgi:hypothetical protein